MDLGAFNVLRGSDTRAIAELTAFINKANGDPRFIQFLLGALVSDQARSDVFILQQVQSAIKNMIRLRWSCDFQEGVATFWTQEQQDEISISLLNAMMAAPIEYRNGLVESFRIMMLKSFPDVLGLMNRVVTLLRERCSSVNDIACLLNLCYFWSKACGDAWRKVSEEAGGGLEAIDGLNIALIEIYHGIATTVFPALETSDVACGIARLIIRSLYRMLGYVGRPVFSAGVLFVLENGLRALQINSDKKHVLDLKYAVVALIRRLNTTYLPDPEVRAKKYVTDQQNAIATEFGAKYATQLVPVILQAIVASVPLPTNWKLQGVIMYVVYQFLFFGVELTALGTSDFIANMLMSAARLSPADLEDAEDNPEQFVNFYMDFSPTLEEVTPRSCAARIVYVLVTKMGMAADLSRLLASPAKDEFDLENKLFLMIAFGKATKHAMPETRKRKGENKKTRIPMFDQGILTQVVSAVATAPCWLQMTMLMYMAMIMKHVDAAAGVNMGMTMVIEGRAPIVVYAAAKLFNSCVNVVEDRPPVNVAAMIPKLLETAVIFNESPIPRAITNVCGSGATENIEEGAFALINFLLDLTHGHLAQEGDDGGMHGASDVLRVIDDVITALPDDSPALFHICDELLQKVMALFQAFPENQSGEEILDIVGVIHQKITETRPAQLAALAATIALASADSSMFMDARQIVWIVHPLLTAKTQVMASQPALANEVIGFAKGFVDYCRENFECFPSNICYGLFLASCMVQIVKEQALVWAMPQAIFGLQLIQEQNKRNKHDPMLFMGVCYVIAASLVVNTAATMQYLSPEIVGFIIANIDKGAVSSLREAKVGMIILLSFAQLGNMEAFARAAALHTTLQAYQTAENADDEDADDGEEDADDGEDDDDESDESSAHETIEAPFFIPLDDYQAANIYQNMFNSLPPDQQQHFAALVG